MDESHGSCADARTEERVLLWVLFLAEADSADKVAIFVFVVVEAQDFFFWLLFSFFKVLEHVLAEVVVVVAFENDHGVIFDVVGVNVLALGDDLLMLEHRILVEVLGRLVVKSTTL